MSHDPKHSHSHDHHHDHDHGHDHHHHGHEHPDHLHDWKSSAYVDDWIARDAGRAAERQPILDALIAAVPFAKDAAIDVLDVGAGGGAVTAVVLAAFPRARVTMQDFSAEMLDRARARFAGSGRELRYVQGNLLDTAWVKDAGGPFDLAVSGIAIHNLAELAAMAACYETVRGLLKSGGAFLDYDIFDKFGGVPLHQHSMKVAGFKTVDLVWHKHPTAVLKATT